MVTLEDNERVLEVGNQCATGFQFAISLDCGLRGPARIEGNACWGITLLQPKATRVKVNLPAVSGKWDATKSVGSTGAVSACL